jgi:hypothetical protein
MAHTYNPSYSGGRDQENHGSRPTGKKFIRPHFQPMAGHGGVCGPAIPAIWGNINRGITVQAGPDIKQGPISKITNAKMTYRMAQEIEHLPSKKIK